MFRLNLSYQVTKNWDLVENQLRSIAFRFDGEHTDSGMGFGGRDLGFEFADEQQAEQAQKRMQAMLRRLGLDHSIE